MRGAIINVHAGFIRNIYLPIQVQNIGKKHIEDFLNLVVSSIRFKHIICQVYTWYERVAQLTLSSHDILSAHFSQCFILHVSNTLKLA